MTVAVGLAGIVAAVGCAVGFVASTVRADARVHAVDPARTSRLEGAPRRWLLAAVLLGLLGVLLLLAHVVALWAP